MSEAINRYAADELRAAGWLYILGAILAALGLWLNRPRTTPPADGGEP